VAALEAENATLAQRCGLYSRELDEWQEREAAVCPEDCSFEQKIAFEAKRANAAEAALVTLRGEKEALRTVLKNMQSHLRSVVRKNFDDETEPVIHFLIGMTLSALAPTPPASEEQG
jgi:hypothetical protein